MDGFCNLAGKSALVTGSSRGIGFALARGLGRRGARVFVHGAGDSATGSRSSRASLTASS
jgi:gluconate 5-dehydrogenase